MKRAGDLNASSAYAEVKESKPAEEKKVGRPITTTIPRAKLQVFISEKLIDEAKLHCLKNKMTLTQLTEQLFQDFFEK